MKYRNKKVIVDGIAFDSRKEARRYSYLRFLEMEGKIQSLELQKEFELVPVQREADTVGKRGGVKKGKVIERAVKYKADFVYIRNGETIVEDTKGMRTKDYIIKRKLMLFVHKIKIREV